jgi:hypothetical protein
MEVRINTIHFTHLMSSGFLKVMEEFTRLWSAGVLCTLCVCVCVFFFFFNRLFSGALCVCTTLF